MTFTKKDAELLCDLDKVKLDGSTFDALGAVQHVFESALKKILVEAKVLADTNTFDWLSEVHFFKMNSKFIDQLERDDTEPVMEADVRGMVRELASQDLSEIDGYFPNIEKLGANVTDEKEKTALNLITEFREILNHLYGGLEQADFDSAAKELERCEIFLNKTVRDRISEFAGKGVDTGEIISQVLMEVRKGLVSIMPKENNEGDEVGHSPEGLEGPTNIIKFKR